MATPEFQNTPDYTAQFQQAYGVDRGNDENVRDVMVQAIEQDEQLLAILRGHLQTDDMPLIEALGRTLAEANDLGKGDQLQDIIERQRETDTAQSAAAMEQVGLKPSDEIGHLEVSDVAKFATALQHTQMPAAPEAAAMLHNDLVETIGYQLYTTAIAARDVPPATITEPLGPQRPKVVADINYLDEEALQQIRDELNPGSETLAATIAESGRLAQAIDDLGLPKMHSRGFRHLEIAAREGVVREWAAAYDAVLYSTEPVAEVGDMFSGRYGTDSERLQAVAIIRHLQETIPGTQLAQETAQAFLDDVQSFLDRPFDPEAGGQLSLMDVRFHDQDHGRLTEDMFQPAPEAAAPLHPDDIEGLFGDFDNAVPEDAYDEPDRPPVSVLEPATPEDSRRVKQEIHDEMTAALTSLRDQVLAVLPEAEQRRFAERLPTSQANSAEHSSGTAAEGSATASVGEIAAIIVSQEATLETITGYLAEAGESIISAQGTVEDTLRDASSDDAITAITAITAALESLKKGRAHIIDGLTHFKRYNP